MKHKNIFVPVVAGLLMSSCSLYQSLTAPTKSSEVEAATTVNEETAVTAPAAVKTEKVKAPSSDKGKKNKTHASTAPTAQPPTVPTQQELCGAPWKITAAGNMTIDADEDAPYLAFDPKGNFYACDGCNVINGTYVIKFDGKLIFSNTLSTMKYCPDVEWAAQISAVFSKTEQLSVDSKKIGHETYLYIKDASNRTILTMRRHNMEFLNGSWKILWADGKKLSDDDTADIFIDIAERKIHGNAGCNFFNGTVYIDESRSNAMDFSNIQLTARACPASDTEHHIVVALEQTCSAIAGKNNDTVLLLDHAGKKLMTLKKITR
ncbi:MAG: META domain-containing protein [Muribaculaceae bacterium]|nr:META domain-containing protein [Muribaculaceae bacterium]